MKATSVVKCMIARRLCNLGTILKGGESDIHPWR
jgi:hypothetical protein